MSVSATDDAVLPIDVSLPSVISSDDAASQVLKDDASLPAASTEAHDTPHSHLGSVSIVYSEGKPEHESKVELAPTTSGSLPAENDLDAVVAHLSVPMKETTTNGPDVDATTAALTSESVMAIADAAEESGADKSIGHDSGIEILVPALDENEEHVPADKPDVLAAVVVELDATPDVEDTTEDTNHTQTDESSVEEVAPVEATEATMATEDNATEAAEQAKVNAVAEDQPQVEVTSEEPAAKTNESEGERETVRGMEVKQETVHEAEPAAAVINNAEDNTHEATFDQHQPAQDSTQTTEVANGHEATLQEHEEPEVTVHVQEASSIVESPVDHVAVGNAVETAEAPTNDDAPAVQASVFEEVVTGVASEEVPIAEVQIPKEEAPAIVEVEARIQAPAIDEVASQEVPEAEVVVAEQAPVDAEGVLNYAEVEIVAEAASDGVPAPVEAQLDEIAEPVEAEDAVEVPVEAEIAEVLGETSAVVEAEVALSEEVTASIETEPVAEVLNEETLEAVKSEDVDTPAPAEATTSDEVADEAPVGAEPVVQEPVTVGEEAKTTTEATNDVHEPIISVATPTMVYEETAPVQKEIPIAENIPLLVSDAEPKVSVQAVLKDREVPEAGIRDNTEAEVVSKPASVALATCAIEETAKETSVEEQLDSASAEYSFAEISELPTTFEAPPLEEQPTEDVKDSDTGEVEPLTELTTEPLSIQTSVDTTPFTPVVDSGIELKEQESQPPNLLSIVEEIERPKSPWSPSFQVTTVGSLEDAEVGLVQGDPAASELNDAIKIAAASVLIVEDATGASLPTASENLSSTNEQSIEPPARPWTPSYSVHLQGSTVQVTKELTEDVPSLHEQHVGEVIPEQIHSSIDESASEQILMIQQETGEVSVSGSEVEDAALVDMTEPSTEEDADDVKEVVESPLQPQEEGHLTSDAPDSSAKLWMPSYSVHAQGSLPKGLESGGVIGAEDVVESLKATAKSKAEEDMSNAEADSFTSEQFIGTDVSSVTPTVDSGNEKPVDEADTTTGQDTADGAVLEVSGTPWAPSYSVHAQGTPVVKFAVPTSAVDATSNESASLELPAEPVSEYPETEDVGETTAELPVLSVSMESSENMISETLEEPWTPSYSVHLQGSPLIPRNELDGAYPDVEAKMVEPSTEGWTPSYSVHLQGSPMVVAKGLDESLEPPTLEPTAESWTPARFHGTPLATPKELGDIPVHDAEFEAPVEAAAHVVQTDSVTVEGHSQGDDTAIDAQDKHTDEENEAGAILPAIVLVAPVISLASSDAASENPVVANEAEGPARPWTPSYSVHSQGSPSLNPATLEDEQPSDNRSHRDETEVHNAEQQVSESSAAAEVASSITHSVVEPSAPVEDDDAMASVDKTIPTLLVSGVVSSNDTLQERPWTPSYSVIQQGSGLPVEGGKLDMLESSSQPIPEASVPDDTEPQLNEVQQSNESNAVQLRPGQVVGRAEDMARNEKFMLFGLRAIVAYLWVLPKWLSMTHSPNESGHSRREASSSSSSKFFPGGWFSTKPNEGRTSLDTAQGEFAASPKTTSDVFETISAETMYREAGGSTGTTTVEDGTNGQNRRWCIVM